MATDRGPSRRKRKRPIERKWDAVRAAVREVWLRKDVSRLCQRFEDLKRSLASAILASILFVHPAWLYPASVWVVANQFIDMK